MADKGAWGTDKGTDKAWKRGTVMEAGADNDAIAGTGRSAEQGAQGKEQEQRRMGHGQWHGQGVEKAWRRGTVMEADARTRAWTRNAGPRARSKKKGTYTDWATGEGTGEGTGAGTDTDTDKGARQGARPKLW